MSSEARLRIVKLDDNNYPEWKGDITGALMSASLDEFIDSDAEVIPAPEGPISQERKVPYDVYVMRQRKAAGTMFSHMTQQFCIIVESEGFIYQPLKIWLLMKEEFQATTSSSKGRAYSAFTRIIFTSLDQYIKDTRSALATMRACGVNFSDDLQELIGETIVGKLPNSMETTLSLFDSKQPLKTKDNSIALATIANRPPRPAHRFPYPTCSNGRHNPAVKGHKYEQCYQNLQWTSSGKFNKFHIEEDELTLLHEQTERIQGDK
ncbi:uncharacterized protein MELLADRAFT_113013 [Melampsora larici-populina 98AG31]|uniref:Retrotransposon Copia-like N-terminal domain-containing protein n=1 Tax=Melampsora larici-populina (strain 98AG31 / pathotype 3-4-7) TaxID=747676 RepID=F4S8E9_MELLP|nr:uncharacterized protein MELLADRAFT_113013 [Melampsora larici-populina 98AG31]EGF99103.1 hypothetical protein MELLADRAFT_113013 [Melampsora larici-populina 98AG31]